MKSLLFYFLCVFTIFSVKAQNNNDFQITSSEENIGSLLDSNTIIKSIVYNFKDYIQNYIVDPSNIIVQTRDLTKSKKSFKSKGRISSYQTYSKTLSWSKRINFNTENYQLFEFNIIAKLNHEDYQINYFSGEKQNLLKHNIYYINPKSNVGLGYLKDTKTPSVLEGIDMRNGQVLWQRNVAKDFGWNNIIEVNDSTILIISSGIHKINMKTGKGWWKNAITGWKNKGKSAAITGAGIAAGLLTGTFFYSDGAEIVTGLVSNVLTHNSNTFLASKTELFKINDLGEAAWSTPLPEKIMSESKIFIKNDILFLINTGKAFKSNSIIKFGEPFIAGFDANTGVKLFNHSLSNEKKGIIEDIIIKQNLVYILTNDQITAYSLNKEGSEKYSKQLGVETFGYIKGFLSDEAYMSQVDSTYKSINLLNSTTIQVFTEKNKIFSLDENLNLIRDYNTSDVWLKYLDYSKYQFLAKGKNSLIIDSNNKAYANLFVSNKTKLINNKLYTTKENFLIEINLDQFLINSTIK